MLISYAAHSSQATTQIYQENPTKIVADDTVSNTLKMSTQGKITSSVSISYATTSEERREHSMGDSTTGNIVVYEESI